MARISDAVIQGLMNPQFGFTGLAEPIGMLMGGAQAQRQAQQRQMEALQGALGAQDVGALSGVLGGLRTPQEAQTALSAFSAGQQARQQAAAQAAQQEEQKRQRTAALSKEAEEIAARSAAVRHAVITKKDTGTGIMLRSAPMSVVEQYLKENIIPKEATGNVKAYSVEGGMAVFDPETKQTTWVRNPFGEESKKQEPAEQLRYRTPDGKVVSITTPKSGVIAFGGKTGYAEDLGLTLVAPPKPPSVAIEKMAEEASVSARAAAAQAETAAKAEAVFTEREGTLKGVFGRAAGDVKRIFGKGDELSQAYADVRALRISDVLKYLPPGPASNADVQLVMSTTIDPIDMDDETLKNWLGAYRRIKEGQAAYYRAQNAYISKNQSNLGFDSNWNLEQTAKSISSSNTFEDFLNAYNSILAKPDSPEKIAQMSALRNTEDYKLMESYETYKKQVEEFEASQ